MADKFISIIIPVYNVEKYIRQCVDSVIHQTYKTIEVILVDDGSSDNSPAICDEYAAKDNRIKVIHKKNGGLSDARNTGINAATGYYIMFIDSDDYWIDNNVLEELIIEFSQNDKCDFLIFEWIFFFEKNNIYKPGVEDYSSNEFDIEDKVCKIGNLTRKGIFPVSACTKIIKRQFLVNNNILFPVGTIAEDISWFIEVLCKCKNFKLLHRRYYVYRRQVNNSITDSFTLKKFEDLFNIIKISIIRIQSIEDDKLKKYLLSCMAYHYCILIAQLSRLDKISKKIYLNKILQYKWLLKYDLNPKVKKVKLLIPVFGINITSYILVKYIDKVVNKK
jgi:glycosyltransferase involved in cell wall biosynthesis